MNGNDGKQQPPYTITGQESTKALMNGRQFENVKVIYFITPSGVHDSIEVPERLYDAETIHQLILAKVAEIERVHALPYSVDITGQ